LAGTPTEYFYAVNRAVLAGRRGCGASLHAYLEALRSRRTRPAGIFGIKLHWRVFR
jgi:hypothetical protein